MPTLTRPISIQIGTNSSHRSFPELIFNCFQNIFQVLGADIFSSSREALPESSSGSAAPPPVVPMEAHAETDSDCEASEETITSQVSQMIIQYESMGSVAWTDTGVEPRGAYGLHQ